MSIIYCYMNAQCTRGTNYVFVISKVYLPKSKHIANKMKKKHKSKELFRTEH